MSAKPLFVVLFFICFIWVFANGTISGSDLSGGGQSQNSVVSSSSESGGGQSSGAQGSPCASIYTVKRGDTLSRIAQSCKVALNDLVAVNPAIRNPHLINVGQKITIYKAAPTSKPKTENKVKPSATPKPSPTGIPGVIPGQKVSVEVIGLPPNAEVQVLIGKVKGKSVVVENGKTDERGHFKVSVAVPKNARAREQWIVTVNSVKRPKMTVTSQPFTIGSK